jgi:hypothetical protein
VTSKERAMGAYEVVSKIALPFLIGVAGWTFTSLTDHEGRLIRLETKADAVASSLVEIKEDIKKLLERR